MLDFQLESYFTECIKKLTNQLLISSMLLLFHLRFKVGLGKRILTKYLLKHIFFQRRYMIYYFSQNFYNKESFPLFEFSLPFDIIFDNLKST